MADQPVTSGSPVEPTVSPPTPTPASPAVGTNAAPEPQPSALPTRAAPSAGGFYWGTGRRKTAVARVRVRPGSGKFLIDGREVDDYFFDVRHRMDVVAPLEATNTRGKFDVFVSVRGGGQTGQAGAVLLGVARALVKADPALEPQLRDRKFLTRDARKVERKKPGRPGARKRFQFSKR